jgi:WD40 repeat protein
MKNPFNAVIQILFITILLNSALSADTLSEPIRTFSGHTGRICVEGCVAFSPDGRYALSGSYDNTLKLWKVASGTEIRTFSGHSFAVSSVAFSPDGRYALSGSGDKTLKLWEVASGAEIRTFSGHSSDVLSVAFSPDGRYALSGAPDKTLKLWEVASGAEIRTFSGHSNWVISVAFSPDGRYALSGSGDNTLKLWEVASGTEIRTFSGHSGWVRSVAFSPDGRYALSGSDDNTLKLWEVASGAEIRTFSGHSRWVYSVAFSPDGRYALSGSLDETLKLWEVASGAGIRTFSGHSAFVYSVVFSPDGRYALSGSADKTLKLWETGLGSAPPSNTPPTAAFTVSTTQGTAPLSVTLDASASTDSDGTITQYQWSTSDGQTTSGRKVTITFPNAGTYTINLVVTDDKGAQSTNAAQQTVTVEPKPVAKVPPVAKLTVSPTQGEVPLTVNLDGSPSSDADGTIVEYAWTASDGQQTFGRTQPITFENAGTYTITLTVTDNDGLTANAQQTVTVEPKPVPKVPPVAKLTVSPTQGEVPLTVNLDGSPSSDADGTIVEYAWTTSAGQSVSGRTQPITFENAGTYTITLTVTDNDGLTANAQQTVTVEPKPVPKVPPVAKLTVSPTQGTAPLSVTLDASGSSDSDGSIVDYAWTTSAGQSVSGRTQPITFENAGTYTITLTVTDNDGLTANAQQTVTVEPKPVAKVSPVAKLTVSPTQGTAPLSVTLDASASNDSDGTIVEYAWTASDGQQTFGRTQPITFENAGTYTITLTVTDNDGLTANAQQTVTVEPKPVAKVPPVAKLTVSPTQGTAPLSVTLDASASNDSDGSIVDYAWTTSAGQSVSGRTQQITFENAGTYTITLTVTDNDGLTANAQQTVTVEPKPVIVEPLPNTGGIGQAIIIAAGGAQPSNTLYSYSNEFAQRMYRILKERGFSDDDVQYMNPRAPDIDKPLDGYLEDDKLDYQFFDPAQELTQAFQQAADRLTAGQQFLLFLHGHARQNHFSITPSYELSATYFRELLAKIPADVQQVIILDTCYSGSFFDELKEAPNRILISSADDQTYAWNTEYASFTDSFLRSIRRGQNLQEAFYAAEETVKGDPKLFGEQQPWLDDNGDGQYSSRDGSQAARIKIGREAINAPTAPVINKVHPYITLEKDNPSATLWVRTTPQQEGIRQVRAVLINPELSQQNYQGTETHFGREEVELLYNGAQKRFEIPYDGFTTGGQWRILYQAQNTEGLWSEIVPGEVQAGGLSAAATLKMLTNQSRYTLGDLLRIDMVVNGKATADFYVAVVFPYGDFITFAFPLTPSWPNTALVYQPAVEITGQKTYSIMNFPLPQGLAMGKYSACGVLVQPEAEPLDQSNWSYIQCTEFELY